MTRQVFLSNMDINQAIKLFYNKLEPINIKKEIINTYESADRISYSPVFAEMSSPFYNSSAMDGIAAKSSKTNGASERNHIQLIHGRILDQ